MIEARGLFLLDQVLEDADVFGLHNLDREPIRLSIDSENETVERENLCGIGCCNRLVHFEFAGKGEMVEGI